MFAVQPKPVRDLVVISRGIYPPEASFGTPKTRKNILYSVSVDCGLHYQVRIF